MASRGGWQGASESVLPTSHSAYMPSVELHETLDPEALYTSLQLISAGRAGEAVEPLQEDAEARAVALGHDAPETLETLQVLGRSLSEAGKHDEAVNFLGQGNMGNVK